MAEEKVGIKIEVDGSQVTKSVGNVRKEIKEATIALQQAQQQFGDYSQEAVTAAKRVAELRDRVAEAAETAKLFDPGAKFAAFSGAINAVAGGFAAVQGALGLVGVESEDLQKQLLKVQSALALSEGLSKITDSAKDFQRLNAVIQQTSVFQKGLAAANLATAAAQRVLGIATVTTSTGFKVLRGAIVATGIGALAIGLIALVQNFDKVKKAVLDFIPGLSSAADAIGQVYNRITDFIGITSEAQRQTERVLKANAAAIRATERELDVNGDKYDDYTKRKIEANLRYRKSFEELTKDESLSVQDRDKFIKESRERANRDIAAADKDRQAAADKVAEDARKKGKEEFEKLLAVQKEGEEKLKELRKENQLAKIKDEDQRRIKDIELTLKETEEKIKQTKLSEKLKSEIIANERLKADNQIREIQQKIVDQEVKDAEETAKKIAEVRTEITENSIADETERRLFAIRSKYAVEIAEAQKGEGDVASLVSALKERQQQEEDAVEKERKEKKAAERIAEIEQIATNDQIDFEARTAAIDELKRLNQQYLDDKLISQEDYTKNVKKLADTEVQIENQKLAQLQSNLSAYAQLLNQAADLLGKNTVAGKAAAIAAATINTFISASNAFATMSKVPPAPFVGIAAAGLATATGIKQIREIAKVQVPGVGGGGAVPAISAPSIAGSLPGISANAPLSPATAQAQTFRLDQQSLQGINTASTRAYVVESDITSSQERVSRLNRAARLG
jgi:hypothetical protein